MKAGRCLPGEETMGDSRGICGAYVSFAAQLLSPCPSEVRGIGREDHIRGTGRLGGRGRARFRPGGIRVARRPLAGSSAALRTRLARVQLLLRLQSRAKRSQPRFLQLGEGPAKKLPRAPALED